MHTTEYVCKRWCMSHTAHTHTPHTHTPHAPLPGFRSTLGAGDVLAHFFPGKFQSAITHQMCGVFDPVSFDKNDGASPPVLVVGPDWLDLDFFFDQKSWVGF